MVDAGQEEVRKERVMMSLYTVNDSGKVSRRREEEDGVWGRG